MARFGSPRTRVPFVEEYDRKSLILEPLSDISGEPRLRAFVPARQPRQADDDRVDTALIGDHFHSRDQLVHGMVRDGVEGEGNADIFIEIRDAGATGADVEGEETYVEIGDWNTGE